MIVVDTSALIAIMGREPEAEIFRQILSLSDATRISAATLVETTQVASRWGDKVASTGVDDLLAALQIEVTPFDAAQSAAARQAFLKYGKGRGHPAQLNQMDCISYALAKTLDAPLLFKGNDFSHTDVKHAIP